jgi:hypothetical protein
VICAALREAVEQFRSDASPLDAHAAAVLDRLVADEWTAYVSPAFKLAPRERWPWLIRDCVDAERMMTRFYRETGEASQRTLDAFPDAMKAIETLRKFLRRHTDDSQVAAALATLTDAASSVRRNAKRVLDEVGRKVADPAAARSAAIGIIKESIRRSTGETHRDEVAALATAILDFEVSTDMVRHALTPSARLRRRSRRPSTA